MNITLITINLVSEVKPLTSIQTTQLTLFMRLCPFMYQFVPLSDIKILFFQVQQAAHTKTWTIYTATLKAQTM